VSSREFILDRVRRNQPAPRALPELPAFDPAAAAVPLLQTFIAALERMGGAVTRACAPDALAALVAELFPAAGAIVSATPEMTGTRALASIRHPAELEDVDIGVVRARFGVAETGSVWLSEREYGINALGFLPQHLIVLLDPSAIVATLHDAYRDPGFAQARYSVLMTGPSATADIEGILIRGAQCIRSFTVVPMAAVPVET
jgi:L-lactate dehydrogenase complex protein LldG